MKCSGLLSGGSGGNKCPDDGKSNKEQKVENIY